MNNTPYFKYITGTSKVHMMNSKMKILCFLLSIINICIIKDYISLLLFLIFLLFVILNSKIKLFYYLENLIVLFPIYIIIFILTQIITLDLFVSLLIAIKVIYIIILFIILTFTTSLSEVAWGFECLFEKLKKIGIPVTKIALRIAFSIKFISILFEQIKSIRKSMAYRGIPYKKGLISSFSKMFLPAVRLSYKLSSRTIIAMKLRFYGYSKKRTNYHENKKTNFDKFLIICNGVLLYLIIWLGWVV